MVHGKMMEVYSKPGCLLCEEAKEALRRVQARVPFEWVEIDITSDLELRRRYRYDIPIGICAGRVVFRHRVDEVELESLLRGVP